MTNPFDIITTRIITQSVIDDENNEIEPLGFVEMGMKLYDEGGLTSFLVGWQARVGYCLGSCEIDQYARDTYRHKFR